MHGMSPSGGESKPPHGFLRSGLVGVTALASDRPAGGFTDTRPKYIYGLVLNTKPKYT